MTKRRIRKFDIRVENSAPSQPRSAYSVRWAAPILVDEGVARIADIGSGLLRNLSVQGRHFDEVALVETPRRCEMLRPEVVGKNHVLLQPTKEFENAPEKYDAVFLISILHTIPSPRNRQRIVNMAIRKIRVGGFIVVDVPQSETYYNRRRDKLQIHNDGFLLRWGAHYTFYKNFYRSELDAMFLRNKSMELFRKIHYCKHLIRIWKKVR